MPSFRRQFVESSCKDGQIALAKKSNYSSALNKKNLGNNKQENIT